MSNRYLRFRCHYCTLAFNDAEDAFVHLFTHSSGAPDAGMGPASDGGVPPTADLSGAPLAAQPVLQRGVWEDPRGWLRRHFGLIVF